MKPWPFVLLALTSSAFADDQKLAEDQIKKYSKQLGVKEEINVSVLSDSTFDQIKTEDGAPSPNTVLAYTFKEADGSFTMWLRPCAAHMPKVLAHETCHVPLDGKTMGKVISAKERYNREMRAENCAKRLVGR